MSNFICIFNFYYQKLKLLQLSSPEVGYGLFAKTDIPAGSVIGVYGGRLTRVVANGVTDTDYAWSYQNYVDPETNENFEICIDGRVYGKLKYKYFNYNI